MEAGDRSFPCFTEALREPRHHLPSSLCPQDGTRPPKEQPGVQLYPLPPSLCPGAPTKWGRPGGRGGQAEEEGTASHTLLGSYGEMWWGGEGMKKQKKYEDLSSPPKLFQSPPRVHSQLVPAGEHGLIRAAGASGAPHWPAASLAPPRPVALRAAGTWADLFQQRTREPSLRAPC